MAAPVNGNYNGCKQKVKSYIKRCVSLIASKYAFLNGGMLFLLKIFCYQYSPIGQHRCVALLYSCGEVGKQGVGKTENFLRYQQVCIALKGLLTYGLFVQECDATMPHRSGAAGYLLLVFDLC
jgi:hypothetical protein